MSKTSEIKIQVGLDDKSHPKTIHWESEDKSTDRKRHEAKAMLVSFFEKEYKDTFKIDLWTSEMQVTEMDRFVFQTIRGIADTYYKATGNKELANDMQRFVQYFGEKTQIIPKTEG